MLLTMHLMHQSCHSLIDSHRSTSASQGLNTIAIFFHLNLVNVRGAVVINRERHGYLQAFIYHFCLWIGNLGGNTGKLRRDINMDRQILALTLLLLIGSIPLNDVCFRAEAKWTVVPLHPIL